MAKIVIRETDLTTPVREGNSNEIVYVPGFGTNAANFIGAANKNVPTLCTSVAEFNYYFGSIPAVFSEDQPYPGDFPEAARSANYMFRMGDVDPSYIYAKELLQAGIPVVYERLNDKLSDNTENISVSAFYTAIQGTSDYDPILNLNDVSDFDIKYITTGGYPSFEYGYSYLITPVVNRPGESDFDEGYCSVSDAQAFLGKVGTSYNDYTISYISEEVQNYQVAPTTSSSTIDNLQVSDDVFLERISRTAGTYTFTAAVSGSNITWTLDSVGSEVDIASYGITFGGTVADGDTIVVTVTSTTVTQQVWQLNGEDISLQEYGLLLSEEYTPVVGDFIDVTVANNVSSSIVGKMLSVASQRGDCVALVDHTNNPQRPLNATSSDSVYYSVSNANSMYKIATNGEYAAMFTPWYVCAFVTNSKPAANTIITLSNGTQLPAANIHWSPSSMPPSFGYLMSLANSVRNNPSWLAIAGVTRGVVPNLLALNINSMLTNAIADSFQVDDQVSINPITNIRPYGYTIWGNRTLKNNAAANGLTATSFLNIRNMVSDIKKSAYTAALSCIFEQNTDILWLNFKSQLEPLLERMTSGYGINDYKIIRERSDSPIKIVATIRIYPVYAVESFDITIELANDVVNVVE